MPFFFFKITMIFIRGTDVENYQDRLLLQGSDKKDWCKKNYCRRNTEAYTPVLMTIHIQNEIWNVPKCRELTSITQYFFLEMINSAIKNNSYVIRQLDLKAHKTSRRTDHLVELAT